MPRIDKERLGKKTKADILDEVQGLIDDNDKEHGRRLKLQSQSIMGLMKGRSYEDELALKDARIAELETALETAREELRKLKGETITPFNIKVV